MVRRGKIDRPKNPRIGVLWNEPYTKTLRIWNGKGWQETSPKEIKAMIDKHGSLSKWMKVEQKQKELAL